MSQRKTIFLWKTFPGFHRYPSKPQWLKPFDLERFAARVKLVPFPFVRESRVLGSHKKIEAELIKQILPPLVVRPAHQPHDVAAGVEVEGAGLAHQLHAGFGGELVAFAAVASVAASDQVLPGGGASAGAR